MEKQIITKLHNLEAKENIKILLAVESGSRAWGFASPDSDYDVRFIYVRPQEEYLRLEKKRDVIELPIEEELDINGWDLQKTLRLLHKSNPTLWEWVYSPIIYLETEFLETCQNEMNAYFSVKRSLYHYLSMAEKNYREYLRKDDVRMKKYFYVLRPILACRWLLNRKTPPPVLFTELLAAELPTPLETEFYSLLELKQHSPEVKIIPRIDKLNAYLDISVAEIKKELQRMDESPVADWKELNAWFLRELNKN